MVLSEHSGFLKKGQIKLRGKSGDSGAKGETGKWGMRADLVIYFLKT